MKRIISIILLLLFSSALSLETYGQVMDDLSVTMELKDTEEDSEEQEDESKEENNEQPMYLSRTENGKLGFSLNSSEIHYLLVFKQLLANDILLPPPELA